MTNAPSDETRKSRPCRSTEVAMGNEPEVLFGRSINTVTKLLIDTGKACSAFHDATVRGVRAKRVAIGTATCVASRSWRMRATKQLSATPTHYREGARYRERRQGRTRRSAHVRRGAGQRRAPTGARRIYGARTL